MDQSISICIKRASNAFDKIANKEFARYGISSTQFKFLKHLYKFEDFQLKQHDLEVYFDMSNPTVTGVLKNLEQQGYIVRQENPADSRSKVIGLTNKAKSAEHELVALGQSIERQMTKHLSQTEQATLRQLLRQLLEGDQDAYTN